MKKLIIIIISVVLGLGIIAGIVSGILYYRSFIRVFKKTDYPVAYKVIDGNLVIVLKDKSGSSNEWTAITDNTNAVSMETKGKAKASKAKFIVSPKNNSIANVYFVKSFNLGKLSVAETLISFAVYVSDDEETGALRCDVIDYPTLSTGGTVIGADTAYPIALSGYAPLIDDDYYYDETATESDAAAALIHGNIDFVNGKGDWTVEADTTEVFLREYDRGDRAYVYINYFGFGDVIPDNEEDPDDDGDNGGNGKSSGDNSITDTGIDINNNTETDATEEVGSCELTFSNATLGISEKKKVTFYKDGHMIFSPVEEKKK